MLGAALPYVDQGSLYRRLYVEPQTTHYFSNRVQLFISPADPSIDDSENDLEPYASYASYAANGVLFQPSGALAAAVPDGTSNTIAFGEHYARCRGDGFYWNNVHPMLGHRASFADGEWPGGRSAYADVYAVVRGNPPQAGPSYDTVPKVPTFQTAPALNECLTLVAQTPHRSGMIAGLADGSVRTLAPGIAVPVFWGAVTRDGGEVLADW